jgi:hypothetical protein
LLKHPFRICAVGMVIDNDVGAFTRRLQRNFRAQSNAGSRYEDNMIA